MNVLPTPPTLDNPQLLDLALSSLQTSLSSLSWLTAYGKTLRRVNTESGAKYAFPGLWVGGNEYSNLLPNSNFNNYSYFDVGSFNVGGNRTKVVSQSSGTISSNTYENVVGLVVFADIREVYPSDHATRTEENVKADVLAALKNGSNRGILLEIVDIVDDAEQIYKGYTHEEQTRAFNYRPFINFRINIKMRYSSRCAQSQTGIGAMVIESSFIVR